MQIIYNNKDITGAIDVNRVDITDASGGAADSLEMQFNDTERLWSKWSPQKGDVIQIIQDGFDTGIMYIDELEQQRGFFIMRALSLPQEAKIHNTQCWEDVRFFEFATELANRYGFTLETYEVDNYLYPRLDQYQQADLAFLAYRCMLEGYMLKISDKKVIIYKESYMESKSPAKTIYTYDIDGAYKFKSKSTGIYSTAVLSRNGIESTYTIGSGSVLKINDVYVNNQAEADRFTKNILRYHNKQETTGRITIQLDTSITAGNVVQATGVGLADGKYFVEQATHKLIDGKTTLNLRKVLEGY